MTIIDDNDSIASHNKTKLSIYYFLRHSLNASKDMEFNGIIQAIKSKKTYN